MPRKAGAGLELNKNDLSERMLATLQGYVENSLQKTVSAGELHAIRQQLLKICLQQALQKTDCFTLTAPTGSGKTLSMLAFALRHALQNNLQRIILVVPYLSIIEQTAGIYRNIFSGYDHDLILEHHSMAGLGEEQVESDADGQEECDKQIKRQRLLSENWDAPIIITTSVQFLESLFSNRPSSCRKIHRIANAVVLFDEVQTLPTALAIPTLAALSHIAHNWNSSIVFATATQPAFNHLHESVRQQCPAGWQPQEIVKGHANITDSLRRVEFSWLNENLNWQCLAETLDQHHQVLCILNLKRHTQELWQALSSTEEYFHLSTNQCPLHRQAVLDEVRQRLEKGLPCRLIATQCIEAGVDVDFPVVYRAFAPLDAMIQAAGRCNREGKKQVGRTFVFHPDSEHRLYPDSTYQQAAEVTASLKNELGDRFDPYDPAVIRQYYKRLYTVIAPEQQARPLRQSIEELDFPEVAKHYRLIKTDAVNIVVPYDEQRFEILKAQAEATGLTALWIKQARPSSISLFRPKPDDVIWDSLLPVQSFRKGRDNQQEDWFIAANPADYDEDLGYQKPESLNCWIA